MVLVPAVLLITIFLTITIIHHIIIIMDITIDLTQTNPLSPAQIDQQLFISQLIILISIETIDLSLKILQPYLALLEKRPLMKINLKPKETLAKMQNQNHEIAAVGGTFDYLHVGHQILLIYAAMSAGKELVIGVTGKCMLEKKKQAEMIQPIEYRMEEVRKYLHKVKPQLKLTIVQLKDPFGPTIHRKDIECIVVSPQTVKGGQKINQLRLQAQLQALSISICPVMNAEETNDISRKISSSQLRAQLLLKNRFTVEAFCQYRGFWDQMMARMKPWLRPQWAIKSEQWWNQVLQHYSQYWRHYHTNQHIYALFKSLHKNEDKLKLTQERYTALMVSIFFHDVIYMPDQKDNEEKSAEMAQKFLSQVLAEGGCNSLKSLVVQAIVSTKDHKGASQVDKTMCAIDMQILDSPLEVYKEYASAIRKEYEPLAGKSYNQKRSQFLKSCCIEDIPRIGPFEQIESNFQWELSSLENGHL